jgi:hypothetical protein
MKYILEKIKKNKTIIFLWVIGLSVTFYLTFLILVWPITIYKVRLEHLYTIEVWGQRECVFVLLGLYTTFVLACARHKQWLLLTIVTFTAATYLLVFFIIIPTTRSLASHSDIDKMNLMYEKEFHGIFGMRVWRKYYNESFLSKYRQHLVNLNQLELDREEWSNFRKTKTPQEAQEFIKWILKKRGLL